MNINHRSFFKLAIGSGIIHFGSFSMTLVDSVILSWFDQDSLATAATGNSIYWLLLSFGVGIFSGLEYLCPKQSSIYSPSSSFILFMSTLIVLIISVLCTPFFIFSPQIMDIFGVSTTLQQSSSSYLRILAYVLPLQLLSYNLQRFSVSFNLTRYFTIVSFILNVANLLLDILFLKYLPDTLQPYQKVALATLGCQILNLILAMSYVIPKVTWPSVTRQEFKNLLFSFLKVGIPSALALVAEIAIFSIYSQFAASTSATAGTHAILLMINSVFYNLFRGLTSATAISLAGTNQKQNVDFLRVLPVRYLATLLVFLVTLIFWQDETIFIMFQPKDALLDALSNLKIYLISTIFFDYINAILFGYLIYMAATNDALFLFLLAYYAIGLGSYFYFSTINQNSIVEVIWISLALSGGCYSLAVLTYLFIKSNIQKLGSKNG